MLRKFINTSLIMGLGSAFAFLMHLVLARFLGVEGYGLYNFIFSISAVVVLVAVFGFNVSIIRYMQEYDIFKSKKGLAHFANLLKFARRFSIALSLILSVICFYFSYVNMEGQLTMPLCIAGVILTLLLTQNRLNSGILRGYDRPTSSLTYDLSYRDFLICIVTSAVILFAHDYYSLELAFIILIAVLGAMVIASQIHINILHPKGLSNDKQVISREQIKDWLKVSFPIMLITSMQLVMQRTDIIMLGFMADAFDTGVYSAANRIAIAASIPIMAISAIYSPKAAAYFYEKDHEGMRRSYFLTLIVQASGTIAACIIVYFLSPYILDLLGEGYRQGKLALTILLIGIALNSLWGPCPELLMMSKLEVITTKVNVFTALLNALLNFFLIGDYGIVGAAIATVFALNLKNMLLLSIAYKKILSKNAKIA